MTGNARLSEFKSRKLGVRIPDNSEGRRDSYFKNEARKSQVSRKEEPEKEEERGRKRKEERGSKNQRLLAENLNRLLHPHLDHHRKRQKLTEGEASTPFQPAKLHRKLNI
ncbi:Protein CBG15062 [Caenorhabditis briggsae]|uniref:Protein CBG15062 n=1 Tax=Caenorhabditis briggsae TaxID=6238 RepID=A8XLB2_CAEBR|nr:Protein CBG15062 [Caenorhabditis briggsae]CAP33437.1 Protein CBG15062 [Caenorhabditis briggsae]